MNHLDNRRSVEKSNAQWKEGLKVNILFQDTQITTNIDHLNTYLTIFALADFS